MFADVDTRSRLYFVLLLTTIGAFAMTADAQKPPAVPAALNVPAGEKLLQSVHALGVQVYECVAAADAAGTYEWKFKEPEAQLHDASGATVGKHYGGPTWEWSDGSKVVGEVRARDPGPNPKAIPWLLLSAKSDGPKGALSKVTSVQRLQTEGGQAPASGCDAEHEHAVARVPYRASYYFFGPKS